MNEELKRALETSPQRHLWSGLTRGRMLGLPIEVDEAATMWSIRFGN
jgi:hypothetical protein